MNVSITEDATMSRTRSEGGATVVLKDAIRRVPARQPVVQISMSDIAVRPRLSVWPKCVAVNENQGFVAVSVSDAPLFVTEQFLCVLEEADEYDDSRPQQAYEEHPFEQSNRENSQ
jgi:hypothetical protein